MTLPTGLDEVGATLEELWMSYNHVSTLDGLHSCVKLKCLFMSNNKIKSFDELDKLRGNMELVGGFEFQLQFESLTSSGNQRCK